MPYKCHNYNTEKETIISITVRNATFRALLVVAVIVGIVIVIVVIVIVVIVIQSMQSQ